MNEYRRIKDRRKPYRRTQAVFTSCRNHGGCAWCESARLRNVVKNRHFADMDIAEFYGDRIRGTRRSISFWEDLTNRIRYDIISMSG